MPTKPRPSRPPRNLPNKLRLASAALIAGALVALAELLLGLYVAGLWQSGRAEAVAFLVFRPWLLALVAIAVAGRSLRGRLAVYAGALLVPGLAESLLLGSWGAPDPWPEMLRGWAAGAVFLLAADLLLQLGRRFGRIARVAASLVLLGLLFVPAVQRGWELAAMAEIEVRATRPGNEPTLLVMTALPIVWGEGGAFDPASRPAESYRALQEEFNVRPIDTLDAETLAGARLLLLAQPRWLAPAELVALDDWVRAGGRVLILTDPRLEWPTQLPLGDIRRPPPRGMLKPLLDHWGLDLASGQPRPLEQFGRGRYVRLWWAGRFTARGGDCRVRPEWLARCRIGEGRAILVADADLLRDDLWTGPGPRGAERHRRLADNPLVVADLVDELAGIERKRVRASVTWYVNRRGRSIAVTAALLLALAGLGGAGLLIARRRAR